MVKDLIQPEKLIYQLIDGRISEISLIDKTLYVHFKPDDAKNLLLVFTNVAGVEMFNIQNAELSKWTVNDYFMDKPGRKLSEKYTGKLVRYSSLVALATRITDAYFS